jgi:hypothetical protein
MIVELKAIAATCVALGLGAVAAVLNGLDAHSTLLGAVPSWAQGMVITGAPALAVALGGYAARHTPRPDLEKDVEGIFDHYRPELAYWLADKDPKLAPYIDELLGVTGPTQKPALAAVPQMVTPSPAAVVAAKDAEVGEGPDPALSDDYEPDLGQDPALADEYEHDPVPPPAQ